MLRVLIKNERGLTLLEMLAAIIILALLSTFIVTRVSASMDEAKKTAIRGEFNNYEKSATLALQGIHDISDTQLLLKAINRRLDNGSQIVGGKSRTENPYGEPYWMTTKTEGDKTMILVDTKGKKNETFRLAVIHQGGSVEACTGGFVELDKHLVNVESDICMVEVDLPDGTIPEGQNPGETPADKDNPFGNYDHLQKAPIGYVEIRTAQELWDIRNDLTGKYMLMNDIDLVGFTDNDDESGWTPINNFRGELDGNGYKISNIRIVGNRVSGLFEKISLATIKNLGIDGVDIATTGLIAGALVGEAEIVNIENVHLRRGNVYSNGISGGLIGKVSNTSKLINVTAQAEVEGVTAGGLLGSALKTDLEKVASSSTVKGKKEVGGLIGRQVGGSINNAYTKSKVVTVGNNVYYASGGLIGVITNGNFEVNIANVYVDAEINGGKSVGGVIGFTDSSTIISLRNGIVQTQIKGNDYVGGLLGYTWSMDSKINIDNVNVIATILGRENTRVFVGGSGAVITINNTYHDSTVNGNNTVSPDTKKPSSDFLKKATYEGWDFDTIWKIDEGKDYPRLRWVD